jgi:hypothetical protein
MKKVILLFLFVLFSNITVTSAKTFSEVIPQDKPPSLMELSFLRYLGEPILKIMEEHGDNQLFSFSRIEKITRKIDSDTYDVSLRVIGYEGPLNPPYKLIRITIRIPGEKSLKDYTVLSYKHTFISDKEFVELSKNTAP